MTPIYTLNNLLIYPYPWVVGSSEASFASSDPPSSSDPDRSCSMFNDARPFPVRKKEERIYNLY